MADREKTIEGLKGLQSHFRALAGIASSKQGMANHIESARIIGDAIDLLKAQEESRILSLEEAKAYLADDDQDKNPLWVQWATDSVVGGWALSHTVEDLMRRYESIYRAHWVLWTQKPSDERRQAVKWK